MMLTGGFVKIPRRLQEHPFWPQKAFSKVEAMLDMYFLAAYMPHEIQIVERIYLNRGEFAASIRFLSNRWGWSLHKTDLFLNRMISDNILIKKRNGTGNGSPSVYLIADYDTYVNRPTPEGNGYGNAGDTVGIRSGYKTKEGIKGKKENTESSNPLEGFLSGFSSEGQSLINQTLEAIGGTSKSGQLSESRITRLVKELTQFSQDVTLQACQAYKDQNCASECKDEKYLLGIAKKLSDSHQQQATNQLTKTFGRTEGGFAIEKAMKSLREEKNDLSE